VSVTITIPTAGQQFGPGFTLAAHTTTTMSTGWWWNGRITDPAFQTSLGGWSHDWANSQSIQGNFGINQRNNTYSVGVQDSLLPHGAPAKLIVEVRDAGGVAIDSGTIDIVYDTLTGIEYLVGWVGANVGTGGGGHDPMLDQILDAVTNPYVNAV
jgi:hypothetical protein